MNRKALAIVVAVVVLFGAAYVASPFWAARQFKNAALSADADRLEAAVDFPAVRESLKSQLMVAMTAKFENDPKMKANPFAGLGMMMIPTVVEKMVDGFVTPDGISALMKRGQLERGNAEAELPADVGYDYDYRGMDRFAVTVQKAGVKSDLAPRFVFERRGIFSWKMIKLEIPEKVFADQNA